MFWRLRVRRVWQKVKSLTLTLTLICQVDETRTHTHTLTHTHTHTHTHTLTHTHSHTHTHIYIHTHTHTHTHIHTRTLILDFQGDLSRKIGIKKTAVNDRKLPKIQIYNELWHWECVGSSVWMPLKTWSGQYNLFFIIFLYRCIYYSMKRLWFKFGVILVNSNSLSDIHCYTLFRISIL